MYGPNDWHESNDDLEDIVQDYRRLLSFYGVFHPHCLEYRDHYWNVPGFSWRAVLLQLAAFFKLI